MMKSPLIFAVLLVVCVWFVFFLFFFSVFMVQLLVNTEGNVRKERNQAKQDIYDDCRPMFIVNCKK